MIDPKRPARYERIYAQLQELVEDKSPNLLAAMATIAAVLHAKMPHHSWTGFYYLAGPDEMHVGPYQGGVACQVLQGRGLPAPRTPAPRSSCRTSSSSRAHRLRRPRQSEIVVPILKGEEVVAVLDIDSTRLAQFDEDDVAPSSAS